MRFGQITQTVLVACVALLVSLSVQSRNADLPERGDPRSQSLDSHTQTALEQLLGESWPRNYGIQHTGMIDASFTCFGQIGLEGYPWPPEFAPNFETPVGSGIEYLYIGALWIGGIVGNDTLVSVGADGWQGGGELLPTESKGTVFRFPFASDYSMVAEYADTMTLPILDALDGRPHKPLGVRILNRSHAFTSSPANNCIFYDMAITNVGQNHIKSGYVGWYVDADVGARSGINIYYDDVTGSILSDSIAYIIDNDGDPQAGQIICPKIFAFKFLSTSFGPTQMSYNWWFSSGNAAIDFGPQTKAKYRDLHTGGMGTPIGDRNKYAFLSNGEWDYDQVMTATITQDDPIWMYPNQPEVLLLSRGRDARFLLSVGPFDLDPGSTVYIQYVTFTGDSVHTDPYNGRDFLLNVYVPELYLINLNFAGVLRNAAIADSIAPSLNDPLNPPSGLRVAASSPVNITLVWDTLFNQGVDGYDIYATPIPDSLYYHKGILPPWLESWQPATPILHSQIGSVNSVSLNGLAPCAWYAINVAARKGAVVGPLGTPSVVARLKTESSPPVVIDSVLFSEHNLPVAFSWAQGTTPATIYNIHKFADTTVAKYAYAPIYLRDSVWIYRTNPDTLTAYPVDTVDWEGERFYYYAMTPYIQISGDNTTWADPDWHISDVYRITAVDSCGFESGFSQSIRSVDATRTKDLLVFFQANRWIINDSIVAAFGRILGQDFSYDIVPWYGENPDESFFMPYRAVFIDATVGDYIGSSALPRVKQYLASGGKLAYFGGLSHPNLSEGLPIVTFNLELKPWVKGIFDVDSILWKDQYYYFTQAPPCIDSVFGFRGADPGDNFVVPALNYDTNTLIPTAWRGFYESKTGAMVATFSVTDPFNDRVIYRYRSLWGDSSFCNGRPVGVLTKGDGWETYLFGFHLWAMETEGAAGLVRWMADRVPTDVNSPSGLSLPTTCWLGQNYPNPFNPSTRIQFALPRHSHVTLEVFNLLGQQVATLADSRMTAGEHTITWNGRSESGNSVASGIYLYRLRADDVVMTKKMVLLK